MGEQESTVRLETIGLGAGCRNGGGGQDQICNGWHVLCLACWSTELQRQDISCLTNRFAHSYSIHLPCSFCSAPVSHSTFNPLNLHTTETQPQHTLCALSTTLPHTSSTRQFPAPPHIVNHPCASSEMHTLSIHHPLCGILTDSTPPLHLHTSPQPLHIHTTSTYPQDDKSQTHATNAV